MAGFTYEKKEHFVTMSETSSGTKEFNLVSWRNGKPMYDFRKWTEDGEPGKGISLNEEEYIILQSGMGVQKKKDELSEMDIVDLLMEDSWLEYEEDLDFKIIYLPIAMKVKGTAFVSVINLGDKVGLELRVAYDINQEDGQKQFEVLQLINDANRRAYEKDLGCYVFEDEGELVVRGQSYIFDMNDVAYVLNGWEEYLVEFSENMEEFLPEEVKKIQLDNFIVIGDMLACVHGYHEKKELIAAIDFVKLDGDLIRIETRACYCAECDLFFIRSHDYKVLKAKAGSARMLCNQILEEHYLKNPDLVRNIDMNDESVLHKYGYNLTDNLSESQRREILVRLVERNIVTSERIASYLSYFINLKGDQIKYSNAIKKWENDRDYILDYKEYDKERVEPQMVTVIKYKVN